MVLALLGALYVIMIMRTLARSVAATFSISTQPTPQTPRIAATVLIKLKAAHTTHAAYFTHVTIII